MQVGCVVGFVAHSDSHFTNGKIFLVQVKPHGALYFAVRSKCNKKHAHQVARHRESRKQRLLYVAVLVVRYVLHAPYAFGCFDCS